MFSWLVSNAHAMGAPPPGAAGEQPNPLTSMVPFILIMVVFYFLFFRPQQKKAKQHQEMVSTVAKGDDVVTSGGLMGKVVATAEDSVTIETTPNVKLRIQRAAIVSVKKGAE